MAMWLQNYDLGQLVTGWFRWPYLIFKSLRGHRTLFLLHAIFSFLYSLLAISFFVTICLWRFVYFWILFAFLGDCINTPGLTDVQHGVRAEPFSDPGVLFFDALYLSRVQRFRGSGIIFNMLGLRLYG